MAPGRALAEGGPGHLVVQTSVQLPDRILRLCIGRNDPSRRQIFSDGDSSYDLGIQGLVGRQWLCCRLRQFASDCAATLPSGTPPMHFYTLLAPILTSRVLYAERLPLPFDCTGMLVYLPRS